MLFRIPTEGRALMLAGFGLVPALEWQAREVSKRTDNCARHAQAHSVEVVVRQEPSRIVLSVADDGRGFDARRVRGLGLVGMAERVNHLGGAFRVDSRPGAGTTVAV